MKRLGIALALAGAVALLVTSCAAPSSTGSAGSSSGPVSASACIAAASKAVAEGSTAIEPSVPAAKVDAAKNKGKTIWYISATMQLETMIGFAQGVQAAADASGLKVKIFDGANSPAKYNDGITQAVAQKADGIILQGIDPSLVKATLATAQAAGIPTVDAMNGDPSDALQHGISSHITVDFTQAGKLQADYILDKAKCKANVLQLTSSLYVALKNKTKGFNDEMTALCPTCKVDTEEVNFADFANSVSTVVRTATQRNTSLNYVNAQDDGIAFYTQPVLASLNSKLPMVSGNGAPANMDLIRKGESQKMDIIFPPLPYMGWVEVDRLQRAMLGMDVPASGIPQQIVDDSTIKQTESAQVPKFDGYENLFLKNWNIK
ncbi:MAG: substrate-binding domain-containing protein [Actinomycetota bacterium]